MLLYNHFENIKKNCRRQVAKPWSTIGQAYKFQNMKKYISYKKVICAHILIIICMLEAPMEEFYKKTEILDQKWHLPLWKEQHWSRGAVQLFILPKHESQCSQGEQNHLVQSSAVNTLSHFLIENFKKIVADKLLSRGLPLGRHINFKIWKNIFQTKKWYVPIFLF